MPYYFRAEDGTRYKAEHPDRHFRSSYVALHPETDYIISTYCREECQWRRLGYFVRADRRVRRSPWRYNHQIIRRYEIRTNRGVFIVYARTLRIGLININLYNPAILGI